MSFIQPEILAKAQHYCGYQERCHQEVKNKLYELGCNTDTVNEVMVKLIETNFLNEERFAKAYAGGKFRVKKWGRLKIKRELAARKISDYCIKSAMKEIDEKDYWECLVQLIKKKLPAKADWKDQQKIITWLMSRGFELDLIKEAISQNN
ncbi:MAG: regulatory protein RecX [Bacteroidia bacterium]